MKGTAIALGVVAITASAQAGVVVIDATDRGWYDEFGFHEPTNDNYFVGNFGVSARNWFVFDLSTIDVEIVALQLRALNPPGGFTSPDPFETYVNYDVTTNLTDLINGFGGIPAYNDLGSGTVYASYEASNADNETIIVIDLNAAAVADANAAAGALWGIGGAITTLNGGDEFLFGFTGGGNNADTQLWVTLIPAPGVLALLGLAALVGPTRRRE